MGLITSYKVSAGKGQVTNAAPNLTLVAAESGKTIYLMRGSISILVAAVGGGGRVALEDGLNGTRLLEVSADSLTSGYFPFDFGDNGIPLSSETLLNATSDLAVTTQATAHVSVVVRIA